MLRTLFFLLLAGAGFAPASAQNTRPSALVRIEGLWQMPGAIPEGFAIASVPAIPLGGTSLQLQVTVLPPTGLACPECVQGTLVGVLDDGLGGIDFFVDGTYHGFALGGEAGGGFQLAVRHADGRRAGWIRGRFEDLGPGPGTFRAGVLLGR